MTVYTVKPPGFNIHVDLYMLYESILQFLRMFVCHGPPAHDNICFWDSRPANSGYVILLRMHVHNQRFKYYVK